MSMKKGDIACFVEVPARQLQGHLRCVFLVGVEAITVEFEKQDNIAFTRRRVAEQLHLEYSQCFSGCQVGCGATMIGFSTRLSFAFRCFFSLLFQGKIPPDLLQALAGAKVEVSPLGTAAKATPATPAVRGDKPSPESLDRAVQMLALLQRDGRLVDFLEEDVSAYPDGQLGAAVRSIHTSCRQVLERYIKLEPILSSEEDQPVTVPVGFDPAAIKLVGNVSGEPPIRGLLRHRGWRVSEVTLPSLPQGSGRVIVAPAEVEVP
jgi:hypothetical protein